MCCFMCLQSLIQYFYFSSPPPASTSATIETQTTTTEDSYVDVKGPNYTGLQDLVTSPVPSTSTSDELGSPTSVTDAPSRPTSSTPNIQTPEPTPADLFLQGLSVSRIGSPYRSSTSTSPTT